MQGTSYGFFSKKWKYCFCGCTYDLLSRWKGIVVELEGNYSSYILCKGKAQKHIAAWYSLPVFLCLLSVILNHQFRIGSYSDTWPSVAVIIWFTIFVLFHVVVVAGLWSHGTHQFIRSSSFIAVLRYLLQNSETKTSWNWFKHVVILAN